MNPKNSFEELREIILKERKISKEINLIFDELNSRDDEEKRMILSQIKLLKNSLRKENEKILKILADFSLTKPLPQVTNVTKDLNYKEKTIVKIPEIQGKTLPKVFVKKTLDNINEKDIVVEKKTLVIKTHSRLSTKIFSGLSAYLIRKLGFKKLQLELTKANMKFLPKVYISIMLFSTFLALIISILILLFFLFFNISISSPFITFIDESILNRFMKTFWILFAFPIGTFAFMYFYPTLEKESLERSIDQELPFATINMAAISGSLVDPTKIFSIIILTKEYPTLRKEFIEVLNGINILGKNLISVLRDNAYTSPSKKLANLFNGLATTINSGGELSKFFEERSKNLLFEYRIDQEKETRAAETFMDIYISVVIAAPMIFMLLIIMIQVSGLGISIGITAITLIMISGVVVINIFFLTFLHLKQSKD